MSQSGPSLRTVVLAATGQDLRRCMHCSLCDVLTAAETDLSLEMLAQRVILNEEEVLTSRTLWSDNVLASARHICPSGIDMEAALLALRREARRRDLRHADPLRLAAGVEAPDGHGLSPSLQIPTSDLDRGSTDETGNHG